MTASQFSGLCRLTVFLFFAWCTTVPRLVAAALPCRFNSPAGFTVDLSPLMLAYEDYAFTDVALNRQYRLAVCSATKYDCGDRAAGCQLRTPAPHALGRVNQTTESWLNSGTRLRLTSTGGTGTRSMVLEFYCDHNRTGLQGPDSVAESAAQQYKFVWGSKYMCSGMTSSTGSTATTTGTTGVGSTTDTVPAFCTFRSPLGFTADMTPLNAAGEINYYDTVKALFYRLQVCGVTTYDCGGGSMACQAGALPRNLGLYSNVVTNWVHGGTVLRMTATGGAGGRVSTFEFSCDRSVTGLAGPQSMTEAPYLTYTFNWRTSAVCPPVVTSGTTSTGTTSSGSTGTTSTGTTSTGTTGTTSTGSTSTGSTGSTSSGTTGSTSTGSTGSTSSGTTGTTSSGSTGSTGTTSTGTTSTGTTGTTSTGTTSTGTTGTTSTGTTSSGTTGTTSTGTTSSGTTGSTGTLMAIPGQTYKYPHRIYQDTTGNSWNTGYRNAGSPGSAVFVGVPMTRDDTLKGFDGVSVYVELPALQSSSSLFVVGFTNPLPDNARVTGIRLSLRRWASAAGVQDVGMRLVIDGMGVGASNRCTNPSDCPWPLLSASSQSFGGAGDTWGLGPEELTPANLNANFDRGWTMNQGFGIELLATNPSTSASIELFMDKAELLIFYDTAVPPPPPPPGTTGAAAPEPAAVLKIGKYPTLNWQTGLSGPDGWRVKWSTTSGGELAPLSYASAAGLPKDQTLRESNGLFGYVALPAASSSPQLFVGGFTNAVPADATVTGILISIQRRASTTDVRDNSLALVVGGTLLASSQRCPSLFACPQWPTTQMFHKVGGAMDKWNSAASLTPANVNAKNFGVTIATENTNSVTAAEAFLDGVTITIYYSPAPAPVESQEEPADADGTLGFASAGLAAVVIVAAVVAGVVVIGSVAFVVRRRLMPAASSPVVAPEEVVTDGDAAQTPTRARVPPLRKIAPSPSFLDDSELTARATDD